MASKQVTYAEISPSEFFYRNRDLAGFSNPSRALYSAVRELVENSLDACEQFSLLPEVSVRILPADGHVEAPEPKPYSLRVIDNGPGVEPRFVPNAFGRVFFGSKFRLRQARGMFGMGGTMASLYGQITTNRPVRIATCFDGATIHSYEMLIDIQNNTPIIIKHEREPAQGKTGTSVEVTLQGDYFRAASKIQDYFKQTALVTPYANLSFLDPGGKLSLYDRVTNVMPKPPMDTKPHPYGIDVEALKRMLRESDKGTLVRFMSQNFHRVGERIALSFLQFAHMDPNRDAKSLTNQELVGFVDALHRYGNEGTKDPKRSYFLQPDASCLSPLGEELLRAGIMKELQPEFVTVTVRPPAAYSGFPFIVEVGLAYGGKALQGGIRLFRYANRIPLLYDEASDVSWKVVNEEIDWRRYHIPPEAPLAVITHVASTKVPFKTVGKEFLADRPELERELKNAVRDVLRRLSAYLTRKGSMEMVKRKLNIYGKYLPLIARFATDLAEARRPPRYRRLLGEERGEAEPDVPVESSPAPVDEHITVEEDTSVAEDQATQDRTGTPAEEPLPAEGGERTEGQKTLNHFT